MYAIRSYYDIFAIVEGKTYKQPLRLVHIGAGWQISFTNGSNLIIRCLLSRKLLITELGSIDWIFGKSLIAFEFIG